MSGKTYSSKSQAGTAPEIDVKDILLRGSYVTPEEMAQAEKFSERNHITVVEYLLSQNMLSKDLLGQAIAESFNVSFINLSKQSPAKEMVLKIPRDVAEQYHAVLAMEDEGVVTVATDNPNNVELFNLLSSLFAGKTVVFAYAFLEDIQALFVH